MLYSCSPICIFPSPLCVVVFSCATHEHHSPTMVLVHLYILVSLNSLPHRGLFVSTHQYVDERETVFHFPTVHSGIRLNRTVSSRFPENIFNLLLK